MFKSKVICYLKGSAKDTVQSSTGVAWHIDFGVDITLVSPELTAPWHVSRMGQKLCSSNQHGNTSINSQHFYYVFPSQRKWIYEITQRLDENAHKRIYLCPKTKTTFKVIITCLFWFVCAIQIRNLEPLSLYLNYTFDYV